IASLPPRWSPHLPLLAVNSSRVLLNGNPALRFQRRSACRTAVAAPRMMLRSERGKSRMPHVTTDDGVRLYYEEAGAGYPIVFVHEFAGDWRSYETQLRFFSRRYRCIAFNARGYPPSDVPEDWTRYSQERARDDIRDVLDGLGLAKAHVVGISMGGFAVL